MQVNRKKESYTLEELDKFESLTSRFARLSDILVQRIFRLIDEIELENEGTARDRINRAEKRGVIESADKMFEIRVLRNQIAHEYQADAVVMIFQNALDRAEDLLKMTEDTMTYCVKYGK